MILTKEMAEKAKGFINYGFGNGVCWTVFEASNYKINLYRKWFWFWRKSDFPLRAFKWTKDREGDAKRRAFIDSLIGKDL